jgi:hypothetical protein
MFDINTIALNDTGTMPLKDAKGKPQFADGKPLSITVHSPGTKVYNEAQHYHNQKAAERTIGKFKGTDNSMPTAEQLRKETAEFLAAITVSFNNFGNGELTGRDLFMSVYEDLRFAHITNDLNKFVSDYGNFT